MFEPWLKRWALAPEGEPIITPGSRLLPVRMGPAPAMLKIAMDADEQVGNQLMTWWDGEGAAPFFAHHEQALVMERAMGSYSLMRMALEGQDDEDAAGLERSRLLQWVLAFAGLSAAWFLEDNDTVSAEGQRQVAKLASGALEA